MKADGCPGTNRTPTETVPVGTATWGRCPSCRQVRPLYVGRATIKSHPVVEGARRDR